MGAVYASGTGRPSYPSLVLLKVLLLQSWYGLYDPGAGGGSAASGGGAAVDRDARWHKRGPDKMWFG